MDVYLSGRQADRQTERHFEIWQARQTGGQTVPKNLCRLADRQTGSRLIGKQTGAKKSLRQTGNKKLDRQADMLIDRH